MNAKGMELKYYEHSGLMASGLVAKRGFRWTLDTTNPENNEIWFCFKIKLDRYRSKLFATDGKVWYSLKEKNKKLLVTDELIHWKDGIRPPVESWIESLVAKMNG